MLYSFRLIVLLDSWMLLIFLLSISICCPSRWWNIGFITALLLILIIDTVDTLFLLLTSIILRCVCLIIICWLQICFRRALQVLFVSLSWLVGLIVTIIMVFRVSFVLKKIYHCDVILIMHMFFRLIWRWWHWLPTGWIFPFHEYISWVALEYIASWVKLMGVTVCAFAFLFLFFMGRTSKYIIIKYLLVTFYWVLVWKCLLSMESMLNIWNRRIIWLAISVTLIYLLWYMHWAYLPIRTLTIYLILAERGTCNWLVKV